MDLNKILNKISITIFGAKFALNKKNFRFYLLPTKDIRPPSGRYLENKRSLAVLFLLMTHQIGTYTTQSYPDAKAKVPIPISKVYLPAMPVPEELNVWESTYM